MSALLLVAAAAAAASFVPPSFTPEANQELMKKYPPAALQKKQSAAALIGAQVDPKGRVSHCETFATSGYEPLANTVCSLVEGLQISPASIQGKPAYGVFRGPLKMLLPGAAAPVSVPDPQQAADVEVKVNKLPEGKTALLVDTNVVVDATGKPRACYSAGDAPQAYADVACTQISGLGFAVIKDEGGKPVEYVRTVMFEFQLGTASG